MTDCPTDIRIDWFGTLVSKRDLPEFLLRHSFNINLGKMSYTNNNYMLTKTLLTMCKVFTSVLHFLGNS